jgi:hypothetical protein
MTGKTLHAEYGAKLLLRVMPEAACTTTSRRVAAAALNIQGRLENHFDIRPPQGVQDARCTTL